VAVVEVPQELIRLTPELCIETPRARTPCSPGLQFGSRFPGDPRHMTLHDFLPDEKLREVDNLHDFAGMLVFDKWTCTPTAARPCSSRHNGGQERCSRPRQRGWIPE